MPVLQASTPPPRLRASPTDFTQKVGGWGLAKAQPATQPVLSKIEDGRAGAQVFDTSAIVKNHCPVLSSMKQWKWFTANGAAWQVEMGETFQHQRPQTWLQSIQATPQICCMSWNFKLLRVSGVFLGQNSHFPFWVSPPKPKSRVRAWLLSLPPFLFTTRSYKTGDAGKTAEQLKREDFQLSTASESWSSAFCVAALFCSCGRELIEGSVQTEEIFFFSVQNWTNCCKIFEQSTKARLKYVMAQAGSWIPRPGFKSGLAVPIFKFACAPTQVDTLSGTDLN